MKYTADRSIGWVGWKLQLELESNGRRRGGGGGAGDVKAEAAPYWVDTRKCGEQLRASHRR